LLTLRSFRNWTVSTRKPGSSSFKTRLSKRDSAVTITETSEAKAKISANKELAVTKAARENMNEDTKQKEAHHSGSEFAANIH
jgi:hypothetical protein